MLTLYSNVRVNWRDGPVSLMDSGPNCLIGAPDFDAHLGQNGFMMSLITSVCVWSGSRDRQTSIKCN